ncbi:MAG: hypothetical protein SFV22_12005 [Saprospiraceae bacterium]|nr:hypothetical protein [Saprospiraceae bacterium]
MDNLIVTVNRQIDGYNFSLMPIVLKAISALYPGARPIKHIFIGYDIKSNFEEMYGNVGEHLLPFLTGVSMEELSKKIKTVTFMDPYQKEPVFTLSLKNVKKAESVPG